MSAAEMMPMESDLTTELSPEAEAAIEATNKKQNKTLIRLANFALGTDVEAVMDTRGETGESKKMRNIVALSAMLLSYAYAAHGMKEGAVAASATSWAMRAPDILEQAAQFYREKEPVRARFLEASKAFLADSAGLMEESLREAKNILSRQPDLVLLNLNGNG